MRGILLGVLTSAMLAPAAQAGQLYDQCGSVSTRIDGACRAAEVMTAGVAATCRYATGADEACIDPAQGRAVTRAAVDAHSGSWLDRTLSFQHELSDDVALVSASWLSTHNSFNSAARSPALSQYDSNQQHSLVDQLRMNMRSLELDLHWFPSVHAGGARTVVVCHARDSREFDAGCTTETELRDRLGEIEDWLRAHPDQVVMLYLEDDMASGNLQAHDDAAAQIEEVIGDLVFRTGSTSCTPLPFGALSRDDVLAAGKQVLIVSSCGTGAAWHGLAWNWADREEERPRGFADFPACGPEVTRAEYDTRFVRYYEDSTGLSNGLDGTGIASADDGIDPATVGYMVRCGVDMIGFDQLLPDDGRLAAAAWSWADGEPGAGDCAVMGADGRWRASSCAVSLPVACRSDNGDWTVAAVCPAGSLHAVPRNGHENVLLVSAAGGAEVLLGINRVGDGWAAADPR